MDLSLIPFFVSSGEKLNDGARQFRNTMPMMILTFFNLIQAYNIIQKQLATKSHSKFTLAKQDVDT